MPEEGTEAGAALGAGGGATSPGGAPRPVSGLVVVDHEFSVPLDHAVPAGAAIKVFCREVSAPEGRERPFLVFFQGGPGHEAPRPAGNPLNPAWMERALKEFRVLLLDQRGTGRSTPVGDLAGLTPAAQAEYLTHFRADSIVADAELIRRSLGVDRWSVLGQSFGGFCVLNYLSQAPLGLREALITGGLPPVGLPVDEVYRATYQRIVERNRHYYELFPEDRPRVLALQARIGSGPLQLPSGDRLSWRRFRQLGIMLGMSNGAERLHHLVELSPESPAFRHDLEAHLSFSRNPLYAVVHEACYADGGATRWSAARMQPEVFRGQPELFTGEHVYPWMFEEYGALAPLAGAAEALAQHSWPRLYDESQLHANEVPSAALVFADDPYVERRFSEETAALTRGMRLWLTNEYLHNALSADGARVLDRLLALARGGA